MRGNGKIIQELEGVFRGAGWNVIKVIWGDRWDPLFAKDKDGILLKRMGEAVDGEYQNYKAKGGDYTRREFFGRYPELEKMVANMSDDDIRHLNRGGHDPQKVYAAYATAVKTSQGQPTVILAKTVKGYGLGEIEGRNTTHQMKTLGTRAMRAFRDRYRIPIADEDLEDAPFYRAVGRQPGDHLPPRAAEGARRLPARRAGAIPRRCEIPDLDDLRTHPEGVEGPRDVDHDGASCVCSRS